MNLNALKSQAAKRFRAAGLDTPDLDARLLIMHATGWEASDLILCGDDELSDRRSYAIERLVRRRLAGQPVDHIMGYREFYGRRFKITKDVLSPRPETEELVVQALGTIKDIAAPRILDLGTGSGAIAISILAENPTATADALDISPPAIVIAKENSRSHKVQNRIFITQSDWFAKAEGRYDVIISNPPYITDDAMTKLSLEVKGFDPDIALRGGKDGLIPYREIIRTAKDYLNPNGTLILEIGYDQGSAVLSLMEEAKFSNIGLTADLSGHDRIVTGQNN